MAKYGRLRERVQATLVPPHVLAVPAAATDAELLRVHTREYLAAVVRGSLEGSAQRRIGFPWSPGMVERSRRSVGATLAASRAAIDEGWAVSLAGGTHHAFPDRGEGFCVFNDVAVAVRAGQAEGWLERAVVLDCDVHQGNGTAAIFREDDRVFTFSVHGAGNYPFRKERSDLDIALLDGAPDDVFLDAVRRGVDAAFEAGPFDLAFYVAGADPFEGDRLGRLAVTREGLAERDRLVLGACRHAGVPAVVVMGGGYASDIEDIVDIHLHTVREAAALSGRAVSTSR